MKLFILKDTKIRQEQLDEVERQFIDLYYEHTKITPVFYHQDFDFNVYPKEASSDGDEHLTDKYLRDTVSAVFNTKKDTIDHVVLLIHRDNWNLAGIWGTNYSNIYSGYQVQACRFDNKNLANSLGTLYHEVMHSHDTFIKTYTGVDINKFGRWPNWDKNIVHGGRPDQVGTYKWTYIRHMENTDALAYIGPYLKSAYEKRDKISEQKTLIAVLQKLVVAYKQFIIQKSTINK